MRKIALLRRLHGKSLLIWNAYSIPKLVQCAMAAHAMPNCRACNEMLKTGEEKPGARRPQAASTLPCPSTGKSAALAAL
ncbi:hypothetical protein JJQ59_28715 [Cupriavidus necator]|nr:hypothetical protein JJQ59_28715 [Cupriavidus necator]